MFYVGLVYRKPNRAGNPVFFIRVRNEPFTCKTGTVAFNEKRARVAVRRFIKGNLSSLLACFDDGINEPGTDHKKKYAMNLRHRLMIPGTGPSGFKTDYK